MHTRIRLSGALAVACILLTGTALGQTQSACDQQVKMTTPARVGGEVTKVDMAQGRVTVRGSDGTLHEFQASAETLKTLKVGGRVEAQLREAPGC